MSGVATSRRLESHLPLFLLGWLVLNVVQALFTGLDPDEAYYWLYSQDLAWGYFDHPPMVALLIRAGAWLGGELGLRLGHILLHIGTVYLIWQLVDKPTQGHRFWTFVALTVAFPIFQIYGFIATPDGPLLASAAGFLLIWQRFIVKPTWRDTWLLGLLMALMLYSKYHGVLFIGFAILANVRLLREPKLYVAAAFGAILFLPHLYWQVANAFPTFTYHLVSRNTTYDPNYTSTFFLNQLLVFSPFVLPLFVWYLFRKRPKDAFERSLWSILLGFWGFFLLTSIRGHVEPHWTLVAVLPMMILAYRWAEQDPAFRRRLRRMAWLSFLGILIVRFLVTTPWFRLTQRYHPRPWVEELSAIAGETPVVFVNNYRLVSLYSFYTQTPAYHLTQAGRRQSQLTLWHRAKELQGQAVMMVMGEGDWCIECINDTLTYRKILQHQFLPDLQVIEQVRIRPRVSLDTLVPGQGITFPVSVYNPYSYDIDLAAGAPRIKFRAMVLDGRNEILGLDTWIDPPRPVLPAQDSLQLSLTIGIPDTLTTGYLGLGIEWLGFRPTLCSDIYPLEPK